ncbi:MAG: hypothetical protein ABI759_25500 [Candidatus Solibacter sp.]
MGDARSPLEKRRHNRVAGRLVELSRTYGMANHEVSLVAVVTRRGDRPGELAETRVVPVGMAQDTSFEAYFPTPPMSLKVRTPAFLKRHASIATNSYISPESFLGRPIADDESDRPQFSRAFGPINLQSHRPLAISTEDRLLQLASRMDSDGGVPGENPETRAILSLVALLAFLSQGHTPTHGAFRSHVARLVRFLESLSGLSDTRQATIAAAIEWARKDRRPLADWLAIADAPGDYWGELELELGVMSKVDKE